jgi:hypothetical protein
MQARLNTSVIIPRVLAMPVCAAGPLQFGHTKMRAPAAAQIKREKLISGQDREIH